MKINSNFKNMKAEGSKHETSMNPEIPDGFLSPAQALIKIADALNDAGTTIEGRPFKARDLLGPNFIPELRKHQGEVIVRTHRSGPGGMSVRAMDYEGNILWAYNVYAKGNIENTTMEERQSHEAILRLESLFKGQSLAQGIYNILRAIADDQLNSEDITEIYASLNAFPPGDYLSRNIRQFTPEACRAMLIGIDSAEGFGGSEIYRTIMSDPEVVERFKRVSPEMPSYPPDWPLEYRSKKNEALALVKSKRRSFSGIFGSLFRGRSGGGGSLSLH